LLNGSVHPADLRILFFENAEGKQRSLDKSNVYLADSVRLALDQKRDAGFLSH